MSYMYICIGLCGLIVLLIIVLLNQRKSRIIRDKETELANKEIQAENERLSNCLGTLERSYQELYSSTKDLELEKLTIENNIVYANNQLTTITKNLTELQQSYDDNKKIIENNFDEQLEQIAANFQQAEDNCKEEYLKTVAEASNIASEKIQEYGLQIAEVERVLNDYIAKMNAMVEERKRAVEEEQSQGFYRLGLSEIDIEEIQKLREILPYFRNAEPINKVIYKVYYEKPYTDLVGRVLNNRTITGIYKITNIFNGMCYVGQAVNVSERWKQHIKRGVGADAPTQNKLYPVMYKLGPENFTFELIEECGRPQLNEREQYWQEFFHAKDFGYSIK